MEKVQYKNVTLIWVNINYLISKKYKKIDNDNNNGNNEN